MIKRPRRTPMRKPPPKYPRMRELCIELMPDAEKYADLYATAQSILRAERRKTRR